MGQNIRLSGGINMSTGVPATSTEIEMLRGQAHTINNILRLNLEGINHEESLHQPLSGVNCLNWVLGHLLFVYQQVLPLLGKEPVTVKASLERYRRGSAPLDDPAEAVSWSELTAAWEEAVKKVNAGLASLSPETLDSPAPFSPSKNPDETVRSLLALILFHQAYHAGQTGLLRRLAGKKGAIT